MDKDSNSDIQAIVNEYIQRNKNGFTKSIEVFDPDIEGFLGITKPANNPKANAKAKRGMDQRAAAKQRKVEKNAQGQRGHHGKHAAKANKKQDKSKKAKPKGQKGTGKSSM